MQLHTQALGGQEKGTGFYCIHIHVISLRYLTSHTSAVCMCYLLPYGDYFLLHVLTFADQHKNAKFCAHKQNLTIIC